jgi:hypothetical protein
MPVTIWRLKDPTGVETRCTIVPEESESCELRLEQGDEVLYVEHHPRIEAALLRANAMWIERQLDGWTEE